MQSIEEIDLILTAPRASSTSQGEGTTWLQRACAVFARRTRVQIREAASGLFIRQGYGTTTMRQIADKARVSERTAYLIFPSKLDLLLEVIGVATTGDDDPTPLAERLLLPNRMERRH